MRNEDSAIVMKYKDESDSTVTLTRPEVTYWIKKYTSYVKEERYFSNSDTIVVSQTVPVSYNLKEQTVFQMDKQKACFQQWL